MSLRHSLSRNMSQIHWSHSRRRERVLPHRPPARPGSCGTGTPLPVAPQDAPTAPMPEEGSGRLSAARRCAWTVLLITAAIAITRGPPWIQSLAGLPVGEERLLIAITNDNLREVQIALAEGASVTAQLIGDQPALSVAANAASEAIIQELLRAGADINYVDNRGVTALGLAALHGRIGTVRALLKAGADPNGDSEADFRPLILAANAGHEHLVEVLLDAGAEIDALGVGGQTALMVAAFAGRVQVAKTLLARGADVTLTTPEGHTASYFAIQSENREMGELLWKHHAIAAK